MTVADLLSTFLESLKLEVALKPKLELGHSNYLTPDFVEFET